MSKMAIDGISFEAALSLPLDATSPGPWAGHIPFAHWIIATLKPEIMVELGTFKGNSYLNFCQSIVENSTHTKAFAIDTWQGDEHSGYYGDEILAELKKRHDAKYASFSTLIRSTFDDAVDKFDNKTIDLLHIDGLHTYEAVRNDFFTWLPKLSDRAVVLFHDTNVHQPGFGVYNFWEEISHEYPSFNFLHSNGLGVLAVGGAKCPEAILKIANGTPNHLRSEAFRLFAYLGAAVENKIKLESTQSELTQLKQLYDTANTALASLKKKANEKHLLERQLKDAEARVTALQRSTSWRITGPLRKCSEITRKSRRAVKLLARGELSTLIHAIRKNVQASIWTSKSELEFNKNRDILLSERRLESVKTVTIITTNHTMFVAHLIVKELSLIGITANITTSTPKEFTDDLYFVICAQMFSVLPPSEKRIIFQMEQSISSRWFNEAYLHSLRNSLAVLDYSMQNLLFLEEKGVKYPKTYYLPISCLPSYDKWLQDNTNETIKIEPKQFDVLFYGDIHNERRSAYLTELQKHFKVKIIHDSFGAEIRQAIRQARIVVNIHYYENALLETTRICECLSLGAKVISEVGSDQSEHRQLEHLVSFVDIGDTDGMINAIRAELDNNSCNNNDELIRENSNTFSFMFHRILFDLGIISYYQLYELTDSIRLTEDTYFLSLPETPKRRNQFLAEMPYPIRPFAGLRNRPGWMGAAYSYKYLAMKALDAGMHRLMIYEDDVEFGAEHNAQVDTINRFLNTLDSTEWDVFSGFIGDLHPDCQILDIVEFEGIEFIKIDKIVSAVCNIYNRKTIEILSAWANINSDTSSDTIDRYLEQTSGLTAYTTLPFLVGHHDNADSTLWGAHNSSMKEMIHKSEILLRKKVSEYKLRKS
ncbi:class I SAM-dependent methyltransferase [Brucella oryzae]|uniref:class I SAM-dependent methyltransferase n=1 Tax=Brucella oryzae TaxID=335286 RepID=UPI001B81B361|nr:class I SAM-dependent methyltransferase [Brucella oryzae]MBR7652993.1 class I SAM-dependent methyltransferase [Brucella oryzae]